MRPVVLGLVDTTNTIDAETLATTAAALNVQVTQHLPQYWRTAPPAVVRVLTDPDNIPPGVWPIKLVNELQQKEGGFHFTDNNQPYAKVVVTPGSNDWTLDASHEALEMLVDPSGNMLWPAVAVQCEGKKISDHRGEVHYLVEICDACEGKRYAYRIGGVLVSDFVTPDFYADNALPATRYSYCGRVKAPRQIMPGGYITWVRPATSEIEQMRWLNVREGPKLKKVGKIAGSSLRQFVDSTTRYDVHVNRATKCDSKKGSARMPKFEIQAGHQTKRTLHEKAHTVTYHQDGTIEREVWEKGATHPKVVTEHVKANQRIHRLAGTDHAVRNKGVGLLTGEKDFGPPG